MSSLKTGRSRCTVAAAATRQFSCGGDLCVFPLSQTQHLITRVNGGSEQRAARNVWNLCAGPPGFPPSPPTGLPAHCETCDTFRAEPGCRVFPAGAGWDDRASGENQACDFLCSAEDVVSRLCLTCRVATARCATMGDRKCFITDIKR